MAFPYYPPAVNGFTANPSQFVPGSNQLPGSLIQSPSNNVLNVMLNPNSISTAIVGTPVKLLSTATGDQIVVDVCTNVTDVVFGIVTWNLETTQYSPGSIFAIARNPSYIKLKAGGAIPTGTKVVMAADFHSYVASGTAGASTQTLGTCIASPSTVSGDLISVSLSF